MMYFLDFGITFLDVYGIWLILCLIGVFMMWVFINEAIQNKKKKDGRKKYMSKKAFVIAVFFLVVLPFLCWLFISELNPGYLGYGYSTNGFDVVAKEANILWGKDYNVSGGGKTGASSATYRIQGINLDDGKKIFRKLNSHKVEVLGNQKNMVWVLIQKEIFGVDLLTGMNLLTINEKNLEANFPELEKGVYKFTFNQKTNLFDIISKDGLHISIDAIRNKKINSPVEIETKKKIDINDYHISDSTGTSIIAFQSDDERQKLVDKNGAFLNEKLFFLRGKFLTCDTLMKSFITMSYETLDKENFIFRCISLDGKLLWETTQNKLNVGDFFEPEPKLKKAFFYKDKLIVALDGFVLSLNATDGKLVWLTRT